MDTCGGHLSETVTSDWLVLVKFQTLFMRENSLRWEVRNSQCPLGLDRGLFQYPPFWTEEWLLLQRRYSVSNHIHVLTVELFVDWTRFLTASFHLRPSCSRSCNQKRRMIRFSVNQTDRVGSRTLILLMTLSLTNKWKLHCWSRMRKRKNKPMTMFNSGPCDWLVLPLLLPTPTT